MEKIGNSIEKPVVLVLSKKNYNALSIVRSLGRAGYIVDLLADAYKEEASVVASRSKYLRSSKEIVIDKEETQVFIDKMTTLLDYLLKQYQQEGRTHLIIGIGCTGGQHRSVSLTNYFADHYTGIYRVHRLHRDAVH